MDNFLFHELAVDFDHNVRHLLDEARITLKALGNFSDLMVSEIDRAGQAVSITPIKNEMSIYMHRLMFLSGKIEAIRHLSASIDTVLNCSEKPAERKHMALHS